VFTVHFYFSFFVEAQPISKLKRLRRSAGI
jgi:hypothetical protein